MFIYLFLKGFLFFFKILAIILFAINYALLYFYTLLKSNIAILREFENLKLTAKISYYTFKNQIYRKLFIVNDIVLSTIVFVHETSGLCVDFINYIKDSVIYLKVNFVSNDRVGYNYAAANDVQESIVLESDMLQSITKNLPKNKIVVLEYFYGGPIILTDTTRCKKEVLRASAFISNAEVISRLFNFSQWNLTHWFVSPIWRQAAKKKLSYKNSFKNLKKKWSQNSNEILAIYSDNNHLFPYLNSGKLAAQFPKEQIEMIQIRRGDHENIWNRFDFIREQFNLCLN